MNFFYKPSPDPVTIHSKHSEFIALPYEDRLNICVPYIKEHIDGWMNDWAEKVTRKFQQQPAASPNVGDEDAEPQQIVNMHIASLEYATNKASSDEGMNILSCTLSSTIGYGGEPTVPPVEFMVTNGNSSVIADRAVTKFSDVYYQKTFAEVPASGRPSRVIEAKIFKGTSSEQTVQMGYSLVGHRDEESQMWVVTAWIEEDDTEDWIQDVEKF